MSDFLDDKALHSNEHSTFRENNFSMIMKLAHPTLPHAASLCVETRELLIVGRANGLISIAYWAPLPEKIFDRLRKWPRLTFENAGYVKEVLGREGMAYPMTRQLPISLYTNTAKMDRLKHLLDRSDGRIFDIALGKTVVKIQSVSVECPPVLGEILIAHDAPKSEISGYDYGIQIQGERYELRPIDRALLAAISFIDWSE